MIMILTILVNFKVRSKLWILQTFLAMLKVCVPTAHESEKIKPGQIQSCKSYVDTRNARTQEW